MSRYLKLFFFSAVVFLAATPIKSQDFDTELTFKEVGLVELKVINFFLDSYKYQDKAVMFFTDIKGRNQRTVTLDNNGNLLNSAVTGFKAKGNIQILEINNKLYLATLTVKKNGAYLVNFYPYNEKTLDLDRKPSYTLTGEALSKDHKSADWPLIIQSPDKKYFALVFTSFFGILQTKPEITNAYVFDNNFKPQYEKALKGEFYQTRNGFVSTFSLTNSGTIIGKLNFFNKDKKDDPNFGALYIANREGAYIYLTKDELDINLQDIGSMGLDDDFLLIGGRFNEANNPNEEGFYLGLFDIVEKEFENIITEQLDFSAMSKDPSHFWKHEFYKLKSGSTVMLSRLGTLIWDSEIYNFDTYQQVFTIINEDFSSIDIYNIPLKLTTNSKQSFNSHKLSYLGTHGPGFLPLEANNKLYFMGSVRLYDLSNVNNLGLGKREGSKVPVLLNFKGESASSNKPNYFYEKENMDTRGDYIFNDAVQLNPNLIAVPGVNSGILLPSHKKRRIALIEFNQSVELPNYLVR
ncbi:MAG: hypothetical protein ACXITV_02805 [Luteibaculaceae bacterium]